MHLKLRVGYGKFSMLLPSNQFLQQQYPCPQIMMPTVAHAHEQIYNRHSRMSKSVLLLVDVRALNIAGNIEAGNAALFKMS